ncbi:MAG: glucodextranase DOMON-like domain-containing protein [bacterium]|nr:glucodextranase DOMON-like domain-containing protein [bacterium]
MMNKIICSAILFLIFLTGPLTAGYIGKKTMTMDQSPQDWTNVTGMTPNSTPNSAVVRDHQWIWQDARNDDHGDGDYVYPTNQVFNPQASDTADIEQVRICWDNNYVYFFLRTWNANTNWDYTGVIITISTNKNTGSPYIIEGDHLNPDNGPCAELRSSAMKADYVLFLAGTWKAWLWDNVTHVKLGDANNGSADGNMDNLPFKDIYWNEFELAVPISVIGSPSNKSWKYMVGWGFHENEYFREVQGYPLITEWYFTGGDNTWWNNLSTDPDVCDLIGASQIQQELDLSSYIAAGTPGDSNSFCNIQYSYVTVADYNKFLIQPSSITVDEGDTVSLSVLGYNTSSTGAFLNNNYSATVYNGVGQVINNIFYAADISFTNQKEGYITYSMSGVTSCTVRVTVRAGESTSGTKISSDYLGPQDEKLILSFDAAKEEKAEVSIYSMSGRLIKKISKTLTPSGNTIEWYRDTENKKKAGSGLYLIKIDYKSKISTRKILLVN